MAKSPSVTILERDMSTFTVTSSETVLAVVGYATKGPIGKATVITSRAEFNEIFGEPVKNSPYSALAIYRAFNQGNQVIFYRVADNTAISAEVAVTNPIPGTAAYQTILTNGSEFGGLDPNTAYNFTIAFNGGAALPVSLTTGASQTEFSVSEVMAAIVSAISGRGTVEYLPVEGKIKVITNKIGVTGSVTITDGNLISTTFAEDGVTAIQSAVDGVDPVTNTTDNILFKAKEKGSSTNKIAIEKKSRINPVTLELIHTVRVLYNGEVKETFDDVSLIASADNFFVKLMNADPDNGGSRWVSVEVDDQAPEGIITFPDNAEGEYYRLGHGTKEWTAGATIGQYDFRVGVDGVPTDRDDEIDLFIHALREGGDLGNAEEYDYHILITPDLPIAPVQDAALALANFRKDFIYIVDAPMSLSASQVADWHNGKSASRNTPLNNSYGALYWPWLKDFNPSTKEYIWCPPSVFIAEKFMEIDRNYGPWYAPAGDNRGRISASDYETSPSFAQRELIYGDFNAVNPFVNFSSKGLLVYGQKTLLRQNSALNRVNTRRMVIYIKKLVKRAMDSMLFEPHNPDSWRRAAGKITSILEPIRQANGLDQYRVVIDGTTNTPDVIAQSIMKGIIKIVPTGTIEIIELTLQVHKAGSSLDE
jgi:hypothetical protein